MLKLSRYIVLTVGIVISSLALHAQSAESYLSELFPQTGNEKVFLHIDKPLYITGETIWLSAYCVDATSHQPSKISKVLNVDIIGPNYEIVKKMRIRIQDGRGMGQFLVTPDLVSGIHRVRAYTSWMKNFDDHLIFQRNLMVLNPSIPPNIKPGISEDQPTIKLLPEGGELINGHKSTVAIVIKDPFGKGLELNGDIVDPNLQVVANFKTNGQGRGKFEIPVSQGLIARVFTTFGDTISTSLQEVLNEGISISVNESGESFKANIQSTGYASAYAVLHSGEVIKNVQLVDLTSGSATINYLKESIAEGISHLTILSRDFEPMAERLLFHFKPDLHTLELSTGKKRYDKRDLVRVRLSLPAAEFSSLSVSVYNEEYGNEDLQENILSQLLVNSDLKSKVSGPDDLLGAYSPDEMDLIMLTHGWRKFKKGMSKPVISYPPEIHSPIVSGRLEAEAEAEMLYAGIPGINGNLNCFKLGQDQEFYFELPFKINTEKVYFQSTGYSFDDNLLRINSPFLPTDSTEMSVMGYLDKEDKVSLEHLMANAQINQIYASQTMINGLESESINSTVPFYGQPSYSYKLDDYTRFKTLKESFIEYIREAAIRQQKNDRSDLFVRQASGLLNSTPALTMLDGIPIKNVNYILNIDPEQIKQIDIINDQYLIGHKLVSGVVNFVTFKENFGDKELPIGILERAYEGIQNPREFYQPQYSDSDPSTYPDFRNLLHWIPQLEVDSGTTDFTFFTGDDSGTYIIEVNGISKKGNPVFGKTKVIVENLGN